MKRKTRTQNGLETQPGRKFSPEACLTSALEGIYEAEGQGMYRVMSDPAGRQRLLELSGQVERAWDRGERSGRWLAFVRAVGRLKAVWLELLAGRPPEGPAAARC